MKNKNKRSVQMQKIVDGMELVYQKLIESTRKEGGELVVMRDGKIVRIKP